MIILRSGLGYIYVNLRAKPGTEKIAKKWNDINWIYLLNKLTEKK